MDAGKSLLLLHSFRWLLAANFVLFPGFYAVHPPETEGRYWVESDSGESHREEILKVHSVVKRKQKEIDDASAWALAATISSEARKYALDPMLVLALINVESRFQPQITSPRGARGLMQILPFVGNDLASRLESIEAWEGEDSLYDPIVNVKLGIFYLGSLQKRFKNLELALTAYYWGPTRLQSRLEGNEPIPWEYAEKVLSTYDRIRRRFESASAG